MSSQRFSIRGLMVVDAESDPVPEIYIRELLDMPSVEFQSSKLGAQEKMAVIQALGIEALTEVLSQCFRQAGKDYDAAKEAELTMLVLSKVLERKSKSLRMDQLGEEARAAVRFMHQYFSEDYALDQEVEEKRASLRRRYYAEVYFAKRVKALNRDESLSQQYILEEANAVDGEVRIITSEILGRYASRYIYHLRQSEGEWKICNIGTGCHMCEGAGRRFSGTCSYCDGTGWSYSD